MRLRDLLVIVLLAAAWLPRALGGQQQPAPPLDSLSLPVGSVVRLRAPVLGRAREVGTVRGWHADTLLFAPLTTFGQVRVPVRTLTSLERAVGAGRSRQVSAAAGAAVGGLLGGSIGALVAIARQSPRTSERPAEPLAAVPIVSGAVIGALLGGTTGWRIGPRRWLRVALPSRVG